MSGQPKVIAPGDIDDIGGSRLGHGVVRRLKRTLTAVYKPDEKPTLPDELLYDDQGLFIWNDIISIPEFYQTHDEIALFDSNGAEIASRVPDNTTMIDLGAGYVRPTASLPLPLPPFTR